MKKVQNLFTYNFKNRLFITLFLIYAGLNKAGAEEFHDSAWKDPVLTCSGLGLVLAARQHFQMVPIDTSALDLQKVPAVDRWVRGPVRPAYARLSDAALAFTAVQPYIVSFQSHKNIKAFQVDALVLIETQLISLGICYLVKEWTRRPRPYVYAMPLYEVPHLPADASRSFFSGHAVLSFCSAAAAAQMARQVSRSGSKEQIVLAGFSMASLSSVCRIAARKHFPTDVITGVLAGILIGYAIPEIHR